MQNLMNRRWLLASYPEGMPTADNWIRGPGVRATHEEAPFRSANRTAFHPDGRGLSTDPFRIP